MPQSPRRGGISATDLMKEREDRYRNDPAYRADVDRREAERLARADELSRAEQPVVAELQAAGIPVNSVWNLYQHPESGETACPILLRHLQMDYPDRILNGIARAFTKEVARLHWQELCDVYLTDTRPDVQDGLAATLSQCAVRTHYEDLLRILKSRSLGESRIYFLRPVNRIGNRMEPGKGRAVVEAVAADETLGREATAILAGRSRSE